MRSYAAIASPGRRETGFCEGPGLPNGEILDREMLDLGLEHAVEVQFGIEVQEHRAESHRGAVHEHELARHRDRALLAQGLVDPEGLASPVLARLDPVRDGAHAILQKRPED